ncbi:uncharacterized protein LOC116848474 [Odontomachus brunneus]|uniref:uncharacterized protein LOC116848474 n=1 Tax=Odontomachus brunneus TaxID=486640 RepID=UPI0013F1E1F0|nr:uncharacterized protein LOC116848474 [Odontomachus brunneus]
MEIIMKYIVVFAQVLSLVYLVALAFPQNSLSNNFDNPTTSTTQRTTTACPCVATAEYNPVCGTDNVTYWNMGRFNCAKNCNPNLEVRLIRACEPYSQLSSN